MWSDVETSGVKLELSTSLRSMVPVLVLTSWTLHTEIEVFAKIILYSVYLLPALEASGGGSVLRDRHYNTIGMRHFESQLEAPRWTHDVGTSSELTSSFQGLPPLGTQGKINTFLVF